VAASFLTEAIVYLDDGLCLETLMPFPDSPRVIYDINPLAEVICQLRFPAILRINSESPSAFQEHLRGLYPFYKEVQSQNLKLDLPSEIGKLFDINAAFPLRVQPVHEFISADELWKVQLTREALSLSTVDYRTWEGFKEHFAVPLKSLIAEYAPSFYTRIGLRYRDIIEPKALGLEGVEWRELLNPQIVGELSLPEIAHEITERANRVTIRLEDGKSQVVINHGLVSNEGGEQSYLIDSDFSTAERTEVGDAIQILDEFNRQSGRLFRWYISPKLHDAMQPRPLEGIASL
jgi:uncharacterized protein (TIGR04255 family)